MSAVQGLLAQRVPAPCHGCRSTPAIGAGTAGTAPQAAAACRTEQPRHFRILMLQCFRVPPCCATGSLPAPPPTWIVPRVGPHVLGSVSLPLPVFIFISLFLISRTEFWYVTFVASYQNRMQLRRLSLFVTIKRRSVLRRV